MFRQVTNLFAAKNVAAAAAKPQRARLNVEALEDRNLMSAAPILFSTLDEGRLDVGGTTAAARSIALAATMETKFQGVLANSSDVDMFRVDLKAGQIFTASADSSARSLPRGGTPRVKIVLQKADGTLLADNGNDGNGLLAFRVRTDGAYYVKLTETLAAPAAMSYTLHLRPMGLDNSLTDPRWLRQTTGGLYAWLDGDTLDISGPVGHGFGVRGNWSQSITRNGNFVSATYTATGTVYLKTAGGELAMNVPGGGAFTVATLPQVAGDLFGEIGSINWNATVSLPNLAGVFGMATSQFGFDLPQQMLQVNLGASLSNPAGVKLGRERILQQTGAPLNEAVPYLYFTVNPLGGNPGGGMTNVLSIVADPADPFLFVGSGLAGVPIPGTPIAINALAYSKNGLIPYTAIAAPSQWRGTLSGQFYVDATVTVVIAGVPSEIHGNLTLNLDAQRTGRLLGGAQVSITQLVRHLTNPNQSGLNAATADTIFSNLSLGVNGELKVGVFDGLLNHYFPNSFVAEHAPKLTVGHGSLVYDGPTRAGYFRGGTVNPLAGTPLAMLGSQNTLDVDAAIKGNGSVYMDIQGNYLIGGVPAHGRLTFANEWQMDPIEAARITGLTYPRGARVVGATGIYIDQTANILGASAQLTGRVRPGGDFTLTGSANAHLGFLNGTASFTLSQTQAQGFRFTAGLHADYSASVFRGDLDAAFTITVNNGRLRYAGSGSARVQVRTPIGWRSIGSVNVGVSSDELWFHAAGARRSVSLPG